LASVAVAGLALARDTTTKAPALEFGPARIVIGLAALVLAALLVRRSTARTP
jgi:hypothetical protein